MSLNPNKCQALTKATGQQCENPPSKESSHHPLYCWRHQPSANSASSSSHLQRTIPPSEDSFSEVDHFVLKQITQHLTHKDLANLSTTSQGIRTRTKLQMGERQQWSEVPLIDLPHNHKIYFWSVVLDPLNYFTDAKLAEIILPPLNGQLSSYTIYLPPLEVLLENTNGNYVERPEGEVPIYVPNPVNWRTLSQTIYDFYLHSPAYEALWEAVATHQSFYQLHKLPELNRLRLSFATGKYLLGLNQKKVRLIPCHTYPMDLLRRIILDSGLDPANLKKQELCLMILKFGLGLS